MKNIFWQALKYTPGFLALTLFMADSALASQPPAPLNPPSIVPNTDFRASGAETASISQLSQSSPHWGMAQVTSVSQLSDVQPTDWAFQALQSLVERYGCIAGYPDGTFRGQRALTRYEFAAGLNACLDRINELIGAAAANAVTREDLAILERLQAEFSAELTLLRGRVDQLEARTTDLENQQFSTTTKLNGEVIFQLADTWGNAVNDNRDHSQTVFSYRARFNFDTSFTGQDLLRTRLEAVNVSNFEDVTGTSMSRVSTAGDSGGDFKVGDLFYRFPLGRGRVVIAANGVDFDNMGVAVTPFNNDGAAAVSHFAQRNPSVLRGPGNAGVGLQYPFGNQFQINLGYLANTPGTPTAGNGIFNGSFGAFGQLMWQPNSDFAFSVAYNHKYFANGNVNITSATGSQTAQKPFGDNATTADNLGVEINWKISNSFEVGGWYGYTRADQKRGGNNDATLQTWAVTLGFPDLWKEGSLGGIIVGMPPKVTDHDRQSLKDGDTSLHFEVFYRWQVSDFVAITPGVFVITNPEHDQKNDTIWVGTVRTTFTF